MIHDEARKYPILWKLTMDHGEAVGYRYQNQVGHFIRKLKPNIVVETGVYLGTSSDRILRALTDNRNGLLWSIDIRSQFSPVPEVHPLDLIHDRWRKIEAMSLHGMPRVYAETGPWDVFLHDSDHSAECQSFEYALAWRLLKPGGWLLSDDITWAGHGAWDRFLKQVGVTYFKLGHCGVAQKPLKVPSLDNKNIDALVNECLLNAHDAARQVGEKPRYFLP